LTSFAAVTFPAFPILPLLVFGAEVCVVTLSTVRIIFVSKGIKGLASVLGFFEVSIWLFAIGQIMQNLSNIGCYLAFAAGFTLGNYLGILIETKLGIGTVMLRIVTRRAAIPLIDRLKLAGYGVTSIDAQGATGSVKIVFTIIKRKELATVAALVRTFDARAFYSVDEIRETWSGIFPASSGYAKDALCKLPWVLSWTKAAKTSNRMAAMCEGIVGGAN
jgi:uncharacterized protein YebE (UPF0316 family)